MAREQRERGVEVRGVSAGYASLTPIEPGYYVGADSEAVQTAQFKECEAFHDELVKWADRKKRETVEWSDEAVQYGRVAPPPVNMPKVYTSDDDGMGPTRENLLGMTEEQPAHHEQFWPQHDDGSASHEPDGVVRVYDIYSNRYRAVTQAEVDNGVEVCREQRARLTAQAEQIGRLICERDQLEREVASLQHQRDHWKRIAQEDGLLSRVEDAPTDPVQSDIDRTIDHLLNGRTTKDQRKGLNTATERAERVTPSADAAVGRALR